MKALIIWFVIIVAVVCIYELNDSKPAPAPVVSGEVNTSSDQADKPSTFDGYTCTGDCSGHDTGYRWAEEHSIDDEDNCDTAADNSNSPSFGEGCKAFVNGDSDDNGDEDSADDQ
jgi:hypothetical protein